MQRLENASLWQKLSSFEKNTKQKSRDKEIILLNSFPKEYKLKILLTLSILLKNFVKMFS